MTFRELLNDYIEKLDCSINDLSEASGLSASVISRYKSGVRVPSFPSEQFDNLCEGLALIASQKNMADVNPDTITQSFVTILASKNKDYEVFIQNYNYLIDTLSINIKDLSQYTNFDVSYMYRIKSGKRKPNDLASFSYKLSRYVATHYQGVENIKKLSHMMKAEISPEETISSIIDRINKWLFEHSTQTVNAMGLAEEFLQKLNDFNLEEYMKMIHFDDLNIPTIPFRIPTTKTYHGISEMQKGELDFFKVTVTSRAKEPIYMYSNMPMADLATDIDFGKKWMFGIAASIKKGLTLNVIHDVNRPLDEMFLGMTSWIPIYMTGQVNGYYLKDYSPEIFHTLQYVSGACALYGECIVDHHADGKYTYSSSREDINYYTRRFKHLLEKATPLMEVYTTKNKAGLEDLSKEVAEKKEEIKTLEESPFDNITVSILPKKWVMIEKKKAPEITFVIKHQKMISAFEQYVTPDIVK